MLDDKTVAAIAAMASARVVLGLAAEQLVAAADAIARVPERDRANDGLWAESVSPLRPMAVELQNTAHTLDKLEDVLIREAIRP